MVKTPHDIAFAVQAAAAGVRARRRPRRRGISIVWVLLFVPVFIILLGIVVNVANVWLARVELENGLEAAALAAVKEWAEDPSSTPLTEAARKAGVAYAAANCVRGKPLNIATNLGTPSTNNPNANLACCVGKENPCVTPATPPSGNLIFGAVSTDDPDCPITFNAGLEPGCGGAGTVLFDAWKSLNPDAHNGWGIAFIRTDDTPDDLRIRTVIIDLRAGGGTGSFDSAPLMSDNTAGQWAVRDVSGGNSQPDTVGFTNYVANGSTGQIQFFLDTPYQLRIEFSNDGTNDDGFEPCDRIRFGIKVDDVSKGPFADDGDGIGDDAVGITVVFEQGPVGTTNTFTRTGTYVNRCERRCRQTGLFYTACNNPPGDLIVNPETTAQFPQGIPNLPCPGNSGENCNTDQSWTLVSAGGGAGTFAVRAQAVAPVVSPWCNIFGCSFGTSYVTAQVTAIYDCTQRSPRLIRVDKFLCPGGEQQ